MALTAMDLVAAAKKNIREIEFADAQSRISNVLVLDVREPGEFNSGCLPGAINIPRGLLEFQIGSHPSFQNKQDADILVCCQSGGRSALATETLQKLGYTKVTSLAGGYKGWREAGGAFVFPNT